MPIVLTTPPDVELVSHTTGVRIDSPDRETVPVAKPRSRVLPAAVRRDVIQRFERTRNSYRTVKAFAREEQARLLKDEGIVTTASALQNCIGRSNSRMCAWESMRDELRQGWRDLGQLCAALQCSTKEASRQIHALSKRGYPVERRPASRVDYRGWPFEFRIAPRSVA